MNVKRVKNVRRARYTRETALIFRLNIKLQEIQPSLYSFYPLQLIWLYWLGTNLIFSSWITLGGPLVQLWKYTVCLPRLPSCKNPHFQRPTGILSDQIRGGGEGTRFIQACSAPRSRPWPFYILLLTKWVPLLLLTLSIENGTLFHVPQEEFC